MSRPDRAIRPQLETLSAAVRRAACFTGSRRRSAHSYWVASSAMPAKRASRPGPGRKSAAMPTSTSSHPATWMATFLITAGPAIVSSSGG